MSQLVDCTIEFRIRQHVNRVQRVITERGYAQRVKLLLESNPESELGVSFVLHDTSTNRRSDITGNCPLAS